jgi:hypothetical protein
MKKSLILTAALLATACASNPKPTPEAEIQTFLDGFVTTWNKLDAAGIAQNYYRMGPPVAEQTATMQKTFSDLAANGFDKTVFHETKICPLSADKAVANVKFARMGKDGNPMAPGERMVSFDLTKFADGWRATKLTGGDASKPLACPVA